MLDVKAFTTKDLASVSFVGTFLDNLDYSDALQDLDGLVDITFTPFEQVQLDNTVPSGGNSGDEGVGKLQFSAADGSAVTVDLTFNEVTGGCRLTGTAVGG